MSWNFDDDVVRVPRSIPRQTAVTEPIGDIATECPRVRVVLMRVLGQFPEARDAFLKEMHEMFVSKLEPVPRWAT